MANLINFANNDLWAVQTAIMEQGGRCLIVQTFADAQAVMLSPLAADLAFVGYNLGTAHRPHEENPAVVAERQGIARMARDWCTRWMDDLGPAGTLRYFARAVADRQRDRHALYGSPRIACDCLDEPTCQECSVPIGRPHNPGCDLVLHGPLRDGTLVTVADCHSGGVDCAEEFR